MTLMLGAGDMKVHQWVSYVNVDGKNSWGFTFHCAYVLQYNDEAIYQVSPILASDNTKPSPERMPSK